MSGLVEKLEAAERNGKGGDNALDVLIEIALFKPNKHYTAVRANSAGTKLIYTRADGLQETCWAHDWSMARNRRSTIETLRALNLNETRHAE